MGMQKAANAFYYRLKPVIPRRFQIWLRRKVILGKRTTYSDVWPILERAARPPDGWSGWPNQKQFALVLTHDVDTACGQQKCLQLMQMEKTLGFRSSFNFVPERYAVSKELRDNLTNNGFEVGVHGLKHDGKLYASKKIFQERVTKINHYLSAWKAAGFRSPSMHHNLDWLRELNIEYDASTFDTDPFEPQSDGVGTIFPFAVFANRVEGSGFRVQGCSSSSDASNGLNDFNGLPPSSHEQSALSYELSRFFIELPYTLPQDSTMFILLKEKSIGIWRQKLDWIADKGGMALLNSHPDYMNFDGKKLGIDEYPAHYYVEFLRYIKSKYQGQYWHALPRDVARFWVANMVRHSK